MTTTKTGNYFIDSGLTNYEKGTPWEALDVAEWVYETMPAIYPQEEKYARGYLFSLISTAKLPEQFIFDYADMLDLNEVYEANKTILSVPAKMIVMQGLVRSDVHDFMHGDTELANFSNVMNDREDTDVENKVYMLQAILYYIQELESAYRMDKPFMGHQVDPELINALAARYEMYAIAYIDHIPNAVLAEALKLDAIQPIFVLLERSLETYDEYLQAALDKSLEELTRDDVIDFSSAYLSQEMYGEDLTKREVVLDLLSKKL